MNPMEPDGQGGQKSKNTYSIIEAVNWYSYVSNTPTKYSDPTGLFEVWNLGVINNKNIYSLRRNTVGLVNIISNYVPFYRGRTEIENFVSSLSEPGATLIFDSTIGDFDGTTFMLDIANFIPAIQGAEVLANTLTAFGIILSSASLVENRRIENRMFSFLEGFQTGVLKDAFSNGEAIARVNLFAAGADAYYRFNLESKVITSKSWADSLKSVLNGKPDKQFIEVMSNVSYE